MHLSSLLWWSAGIRLALVLWGEFQDRVAEVPYTDIDYTVFTDAARFVAAGQSPYERSTYRYSPLLAYMLLPNIWVHPAWGKLLFSGLDILVGWLTAQLVQRLGGSQSQATTAAAVWLYNPYTATISTRGSCDVLVVVLLLAALYWLNQGAVAQAAVVYGLAVHLRIYPIIYVPSILLFLTARSMYRAAQRQAHGQSVAPAAVTWPHSKVQADQLLTCLMVHALFFGFLSGGVFLGLGAAFRRLYGEPFVQEAFLHHVGRKDPRHNFSMYYYTIYLTYFAPTTASSTAAGVSQDEYMDVFAAAQSAASTDPMSQAMDALGHILAQAAQVACQPAMLAFLPQLVLLLASAYKLHANLPLCWLTQTLVFVALNKVCTAQYFVWWLWLVPILLHQLPRPLPRSLPASAALWVLAQLHWLAWAYLFEFKGLPVHLGLWAAGVLFLAANVFLLCQVLVHVAPGPSFLQHSVMDQKTISPTIGTSPSVQTTRSQNTSRLLSVGGSSAGAATSAAEGQQGGDAVGKEQAVVGETITAGNAAEIVDGMAARFGGQARTPGTRSCRKQST